MTSSGRPSDVPRTSSWRLEDVQILKWYIVHYCILYTKTVMDVFRTSYTHLFLFFLNSAAVFFYFLLNSAAGCRGVNAES